jgi:hypothetical protein
MKPGAKQSARGEPHAPGALVVHPICGPPEGMDVRAVLLEALARHLDNRLGGNVQLNRLEAERLLSELFMQSPPARIAG